MADNTRWLLILDHADGLIGDTLRSYFPVTNAGCILITTCDARVRDPRLSTHAIQLDMLSADNGLSVLLKRAAISSCPDADKFGLMMVQKLGRLPLAIDRMLS